MGNNILSKKETKLFRNRVEYEDQLLNTRTNIVLTLNGLAAVAANFTDSGIIRFCIASVVIIANILWLVCAFDARYLIHRLIDELRNSNKISVDESFRYEVQKTRFRIGTTNFMSIYLPILLLIAWISGLLLSIWFPGTLK